MIIITITILSVLLFIFALVTCHFLKRISSYRELEAFDRRNAYRDQLSITDLQKHLSKANREIRDLNINDRRYKRSIRRLEIINRRLRSLLHDARNKTFDFKTFNKQILIIGHGLTYTEYVRTFDNNYSVSIYVRNYEPPLRYSLRVTPYTSSFPDAHNLTESDVNNLCALVSTFPALKS